jgi:hypothetical protein
MKKAPPMKQKATAKKTTVVKERKAGLAHGARQTPDKDFDLPVVDPDFLITETDPKKLHAFARGLLRQLRKPSRKYPLEMVKAATVWLVGAYVEAQVPLAPQMDPLIAGLIKWDRRASTFRKAQAINDPAYWTALSYEASKPADRKGKAPSAASLYAVAKHVLGLDGSGLPRQGTRIPRNTDSEPNPHWNQKSAEATIRGWRKLDHYRLNVQLLRS